MPPVAPTPSPCVVYRGMLTETAVAVTVNGQPLADQAHRAGLAPGPYAWGCLSPAAYRLGLAILLHHLPDEVQALLWYREFTRRVVLRLPSREWSMTERDIAHALRSAGARVTG